MTRRRRPLSAAAMLPSRGRRFLLAAALAIAAVLLAPSARAEDVLHLYNWNNYISEETLRDFDPKLRRALSRMWTEIKVR